MLDIWDMYPDGVHYGNAIDIWDMYPDGVHYGNAMMDL